MVLLRKEYSWLLPARAGEAEEEMGVWVWSLGLMPLDHTGMNRQVEQG